jgi:hypothetical protein
VLRVADVDVDLSATTLELPGATSDAETPSERRATLVVFDALGDALNDEAIPVIEIECRRDKHPIAVPSGRFRDADDADGLIAVLTFTGLYVHVFDPQDLRTAPSERDVGVIPGFGQPFDRGFVDHPVHPSLVADAGASD